MFSTISGYITKNILTALVLISLVLAAIIFLTQSLKFLELVIRAGAAGGTFWLLTLLALPRFLEIILPLSLAISAIFIYYRMMSDHELTVLRASGFSPLSLAKPALGIACLMTVLLWMMTLWITPQSMRKVEFMQQTLKTEFSSILFQEGIFNRFGNNITVFIRDRGSDGELRGLMIHDTRERNPFPVTITAKSGKITTTEDGKIQVIVYEGSRQDYNPEDQILNRLDFERYKIDLPSTASISDRWRDANERTTWELLYPDMDNEQDAQNLDTFRIELQRRILSPILSFTFLCLVFPILLLGPQGRQGLVKRVALASLSILIIQALYLAGFNLTRKNEILGTVCMYVLIFMPIFIGLALISPWGESIRRTVFFPQKNIDKDIQKGMAT